MKRLLISAVTASLLAGILATSVAASISAAEQANVFDGTNLSGSSTQFVYGTSNSNLNGIGWDNRISSLKTTTVIGHGFVFWTGPTYTDLQFKVCGPTTRNTMPSGFNNTISSYQSTTSCPQ